MVNKVQNSRSSLTFTAVGMSPLKAGKVLPCLRKLRHSGTVCYASTECLVGPQEACKAQGDAAEAKGAAKIPHHGVSLP